MINNEYAIKLAAIEEYKQVLKYKKVYWGLIESFLSIVIDLFRYVREHSIDLPNSYDSVFCMPVRSSK